MTEPKGPAPDAELIDAEAAPFTVEELIAAHVLLGQREAEARRIWTHAAAEIRRSRAAFDADVRRPDPEGYPAFGIAITPDSLIAISLVSEAAAQRVQAFRLRLRRHPPGLSADERRHREREWNEDERRWRSRRAELLLALGREEP